MNVRTRFAPSPTGLLHLGNVRTAVFNWLFTRHHGGTFVLRLEDTDVARNVEGSEAALMEDLRWLGLEWDEGPDVGGAFGPYRQSERDAVYGEALGGLLETGAAFRCFCQEGEGQGEGGGWARYPGTCRGLDPSEAAARAAAGEPWVARFRAPDEGVVTARDAVRGEVSVPAADVDDFVLRRSDGRVTYNFAVVVDDVSMAISHVIRGAGHLSNTPRQALLFDALGAERPVFAHLPTVLDPDGGKLSKRAGATSVAAYREAGWLPDALVNYLSLLGWSDPGGEEILTRDELVARVDLDRVGASDTAFDPDKLRWVGSQHMARLGDDEVLAGVGPWLEGVPELADPALRRSAVEALRSRLAAFGEIGEHLPLVLPERDAATRGRRALAHDEGARMVLRAVLERVRGVDPWDPDALGSAVREAGKDLGVRGPGLFHPVRLALTGEDRGPDLARIMHILGRSEVESRLRAALEGPNPV